MAVHKPIRDPNLDAQLHRVRCLGPRQRLCFDLEVYQVLSVTAMNGS